MTLRRKMRAMLGLPSLRVLGRRRAQPRSSAVPPGDYGTATEAVRTLLSPGVAYVSIAAARRHGKSAALRQFAEQARRVAQSQGIDPANVVLSVDAAMLDPHEPIYFSAEGNSFYETYVNRKSLSFHYEPRSDGAVKPVLDREVWHDPETGAVEWSQDDPAL